MRYLVELEPIGDFFFGGEKGYREKTSGNNDTIPNKFSDKEDISYIVKSRLFPQQTSLLGMLRYETLVQNNKFKIETLGNYSIKQKNMMKELIGKKSFDIEKNNQSFGKIRNISPIFLKKDKDNFINSPKDHVIHKNSNDKNLRNDKYTPFEFKDEKEYINTNVSNNTPVFKKKKKYNPKSGLAQGFINSDRDYKQQSDLFESVGRVGIDVDAKKEAFYKQISYKLKKGIHFSFLVEFDGELKGGKIVYLGQRKSSFKLSVSEFDRDKDKFKEIFTKINEDNEKIVLLSNCYMDNKTSLEINKNTYFMVNNATPFRNLKTDYDNNKLKRLQKRYNFWEKGSVLYPLKGEKEKIISLIEKNANLKKIGYNTAI